MDPAFRAWFEEFQTRNPTYLVTGSDYTKTVEQVGWKIAHNARKVFNCCGNEVREQGILKQQKDWKPDLELIAALEEMLEHSKFSLRTGNHIEFRTGLTNFSIVGRNADREQRQQYVDYDLASGERESIAIRLGARFPNIEFSIAGETGIDIHPIGRDKSQIKDMIEDRPLVFFGDKTMPGGNDYALACVADLVHKVDNWQHTWELLRMVNNG